MASSNRPVGRVNYVLRTLLVTGIAFALEFLGDGLLHLSLLPRYSYALQRVVVFGLVGSFLIAVIDGRLLDIGLPRWYKYPVFAVWLLSTSLSAFWPSRWPLGLALFALMLMLGLSLPGKPLRATRASVGRVAEAEENAPSLATIKFPPRLMVSPLAFLRSLLTIACLWFPLIWLEVSGYGAGLWIARCGYAILTFVWFLKVLGRLGDAGRLPSARSGYFLIAFFVLLMGVLHQSPTATITSTLTAWLKHINGYEVLVLFLLIQVPLGFLQSKPGTLEKEGSKKPPAVKTNVKTNELALCGPFEYLRILLVIACLWIPLIYMDHVSGGSAGSWIARLGYLILGCFWLTFANGRLEDAGWGHSLYPSQYFLVVSVASLMPLAARWANGYEALALFVLIQIPIVFLRSRHAPEATGL